MLASGRPLRVPLEFIRTNRQAGSVMREAYAWCDKKC